MKKTKVNPAKASAVSQIQDLLSRSKSVAVVDYKGLKVSQATDLRKIVKKAGGQYLVTKNTLFKIAVNQPELKLEGISAFIFSLTDEIAPIRAISDYAKKNALPVFKMGFLGEKVLSADEVTRLSRVPNRETSYQSLATNLNSPFFRLVYDLKWNISQLVRTIDAVRASKS